MTLNCWVTPRRAIKNQSQKISGRGWNKKMDLINNYSRLGNLSPECFHFPRLRNGSLIGLRGLSEGSCQASGVFICAWPSNHSPGRWPSGRRPHEGLYGTAVWWVSPEAPLFPENPRFWGDRVTEGKRPHSLVLWQGFTAPQVGLVAAEEK